MEKRISYLRDWQVAGPFPYDPDVDLVQFHYGPEEQPALDSIYKRKDGIEIRWQKAELKQDGMVDLLQLYGSENSIAYAQSQIVAEKDQKASLQINSDDGVEIWINGDKVFSNHVFRSASSETDRVPISLKRGKNSVLLKISQGMGGWEFRAALDVDAETEER